MKPHQARCRPQMAEEEQTALDSLKEALVGDTIPKPSKLLKMTAFPSGPWKEVSIDFA